MGSPLSRVRARLTVGWSWEVRPGRSARLSSCFPSLLLDVAAVCEACCGPEGEAVPAAPRLPLHSPSAGAWLRRLLSTTAPAVLHVQPSGPAKPDG